MPARHPVAELRLPPAAPLAEILAEYIVQLLRRLAPERGRPARATVRQPVEDQTAALDTAPAWVRDAFARATKHRAGGLSDQEARALVARDRLLHALAQRGLTQAELARRVKKTPASISRILRAPHRSRMSTLVQIADVLDVELADILAPAHKP